MDARTYWDAYVNQSGGRKAVAAKLGVPYSTIAGICNGDRGIGRDMAARMAAADPGLDASLLLWVRRRKGAMPARQKNAVAAHAHLDYYPVEGDQCAQSLHLDIEEPL